MLEIAMNDVVKSYGFDTILNEASFEIMTGDRIAVVGRNGAGKTTILKILTGEEPINAGLVTIRKGATLGYLEQIPRQTDLSVTTRAALMAPFAHLTEIEERLRALEADMATETDGETLDKRMRSYAHWQAAFEAQGGFDIEERFGRIVTGFGLTDLLDRPFQVLSGGQKTIVTLACVMLRQPDILLLDEPTNHLDVRTLEWFEAYLAKYAGTVIMVSHDRYFLDKVARKTLVLEDGVCTLYHGNYTQALAEQEAALLRTFEQYKTQQRQIEAMKEAIKRFRDWGDRGNNAGLYKKAKQLELRLEKMEMIARPQLERRALPIAFSGGRTAKEILRINHLSLSAGELSLLEDIGFTLYAKERACLIGDNGTGKTTFLRAILGTWPVREDAVYLAESARIGYIPQEIRFEDDALSVLDAFRAEAPMAEGAARAVLAKAFFVGDQVRQRVSGLSGGEKALLKLSILLQRRINFLILDEPTNHIDIETREILENALLDFDGTILFVSHDRYFIQKIATRILEIRERCIENYAGDYAYYQALRDDM